MTEEPITIDGINVTECKDFFESECFNGEKFRWCKDNSNCYYKQLKRKEEECEMLKSEIMQIDTYLEADKETIDQLKAELLDQEAETLKAGEIIQQLKAEKEVIRNYLGCSDNETILQKLDALVDEGIAWHDLSQHYKQGLEEIRKMQYKIFCSRKDVIEKCEEVLNEV